MSLASDIDMAIGVGMVELGLMRMSWWKIMYLMVEWPVSGQSCQLTSEDMVKLVCGIGVGSIRCRRHWKWRLRKIWRHCMSFVVGSL
jgi:hypothetical protein